MHFRLSVSLYVATLLFNTRLELSFLVTKLYTRQVFFFKQILRRSFKESVAKYELLLSR